MLRQVQWRYFWISLYLVAGAYTCVIALLAAIMSTPLPWEVCVPAGLVASMGSGALLNALIREKNLRELGMATLLLTGIFVIGTQWAQSGRIHALATLAGSLVGLLVLALAGGRLRPLPEEQEGTIGMLTTVFVTVAFLGALFVHSLCWGAILVGTESISSVAYVVFAVGATLLFLASPFVAGYAVQFALPREAEGGIVHALWLPVLVCAWIVFREHGFALALWSLLGGGVVLVLISMLVLPGARMARDSKSWKGRVINPQGAMRVIADEVAIESRKEH